MVPVASDGRQNAPGAILCPVVNPVDVRLARYSADLPSSVADDALRELSHAANHGLLWFGVAGLLATRRGPTRRAALRGIAAITLASTTANAIGKPIFPRRRPAAELIPIRRRVHRWPRSSSFPSGHAASAAAFATAVALESPAAGAAIAPLAAAVAYSRVHTGVHWPTDVLAGAGLGIGMGLATRRWWPVRTDEPAAARPAADLPRLVDGEGLAVLVNPSSGPDSSVSGGRIGGEDLDGDPAATIREVWPAATVHVLAEGEDAGAVLRGLARGATALAVAGGDGTVAAAATVAAERDLPLTVIPAGTLNHFARDLGVGGLDEVREAVAAGEGSRVSLATVQVDGDHPRWFVNTSSLGGYPDMVRIREKLQDRIGKWAAAGIALARVLRGAQPLEVEMDGRRRKVWLLFVGNGSYQPKGFAPVARSRLDAGLLDVRYLRADVGLSRSRFLGSVLLGTLHRSRTYVQRDVAELDVEVHGAPVRIATDGEVGAAGRRFRFVGRTGALTAYRPK
jgi:diacylglycerol kinase family enzyme/membrane-associated phospholipid phosphatase